MIYYPDCSDSFNADLDALGDADAALMLELTDLIWDNDEVRDMLAQDRARRLPHPRFDTEPLVQWNQAGYNISRVKLWSADGQLLGARLLYATDHSALRPRIVLLGVMPRNDDRDEDYQLDTPYGERLKRDYEDCCVPLIPRGH